MIKRGKLMLGVCVFLFIVLIASTIFIAGCAPDEPENEETVAAPDEVIEWTVTTPWPSGTLLQDMGVTWAEKVENASGGRLKIDISPGGTIVGPMEILDAVDARTVDAIHGWTGYWLGHHDAVPFFSSTPMLFEPASHLTWLLKGDGGEYLQRLYQEEMGRNVVPFTCGATHSEILAYADVPLGGLEDWEGTKYRTVGWWATILSEMGVSVTTLPGDEVYPSLERGVIDAAEFSSPAIDYTLGFHEVTDYYTGPGIHQPSNSFEILVNKDAYNELPKDLQYIVEMAATATTLEIWAEDKVKGFDILDIYEEEGLERIELEKEAQIEFREQAWDFIEEEVEGNEFAEEVWENAREFYLEYIDYDNFMIPARDIPDKWKQ